MELVTLIVLAQMTDSYIRWLAFSGRIFDDVKSRLFAISAIWGAASFVVYSFVFCEYGINTTTYKAILFVGWLPYFFIAAKLIPWGLPQHIFVFGMGVICSLVQHTVCAVTILTLFCVKTDSELILIEAAGYLLLFAVFLPVCGRYFLNLLPSREFFDLRPQGIYVALLPLVIISGHLIRLADGVLVHSWEERLSRIYLPLVFFFFYRYILTAAKNFYDLQRLKREKQRLEEQIAALKEYNELIQENQRQVSIMRHDLRHSYNLIYAMLESGDIEKAREHINKQKQIIDSGGGYYKMNELVSIEITLIQLSSAYLRYLPFSRELTAAQIDELKRKFLMWSVAGFVINLFLFADGVSYRAYKSSLAVGWIPYFLLSITVIRRVVGKHVFTLGMQGLWSFMLHAFAGMIVALIYGAMAEEFLPLQLAIYLLLFAVLIKPERQFFTSLFPKHKFFKERSLDRFIAIFPLAILVGATISVIDVTFLPTWKDRFSRVVFPIFFLLMYRSVGVATSQVEEKQLQEQRTRFLNQQMASLKEHNALMEKRRQEVDALREDLSKNYRIMDDLLSEGKISDAMAYIQRQANLLNSTQVKVFSRAPLINAALSIYFNRAEEAGIKVNHKIDLPATFSTDESDLAVLLSNLLENAITAGKKQPPSARELSVIVRYDGGQYVLEISNRFDFPIKLGENGLPYTSETGHGLGMSSLETFAEKYGAFVNFEHKNGQVRLSMYWNG